MVEPWRFTLLHDAIRREIDAEHEKWQQELGMKPTWHQRLSWYRDRLLREIFQRRRGQQ